MDEMSMLWFPRQANLGRHVDQSSVSFARVLLDEILPGAPAALEPSAYLPRSQCRGGRIRSSIVACVAVGQRLGGVLT